MIKKTILALAALTAGVSSHAAEAAKSSKSDLSVTLDTTYATDYVFRAVRNSEGAIQPSIEATYADFYAGAWYTSPVNTNTTSETDLYAGYNLKACDSLSFDFGVTRFLYDGQSAGDTTEAFVGASMKSVVTPSLYYYYDFDREVSTIEASLGYSLPLEVIKASLDFTGKVGYVVRRGDLGLISSETLLPTTNNDYTYFSGGVAVPYKLSETATLTVGVEYIYNSEKSLSWFNDSKNDPSIVVGKAGISIGF